ncbi:MAG: hypothetical protein K2Y20_05035 [Sphingomonas sp.]|nr:hypothetical protein [Sphingomonas sp.]
MENMFGAVARNADIERLIGGIGAAEAFVPHRAAIAQARHPGIVAEQPEIGDRIADEHQPVAGQRGLIFQRFGDRDLAFLPIIQPRDRLSSLEVAARCRPREHRRGEQRKAEPPR